MLIRDGDVHVWSVSERGWIPSSEKSTTDGASTRTRFTAASDLPVVFSKPISVATPADPSSLGDLLNWYKADALTLNDGDSVTSWTNSGSGSAATPGVAPIYKAGIVNGKPVVRFHSGAYLSFTGRTNVRTVYVVISYDFDALTNPLPSLGIGHDTTADWVGNEGTRVFVPSASLGTNIVNGSAWYNGHSYPVKLLSKSPNFAVYSFVTAGNTSLSRLGTDRATYFLEGDLAEVILCSTAHSTGTRQSIESYLISKYGITMPMLLVADGDSITADQPLFGSGVGDAEAAWCTQAELNLGPELNSFDVIDCGVGGQKWSDVISDMTTEIDPLLAGADRPRYIVAAMCGTNDLIAGTSLSTMESQAQQYYSGRQNAGALVIAITIPNCATAEATRLSYNQYLRDHWTEFADALADSGGDVRLSDSTNTAYFNPSDIHPNSAGLAVISEYVQQAILSVLSVSRAPDVEFVDPNSYEPSIWMRTSTFIGFKDGDAVASPPNSAISAVTLNQSTGANQPLYKTALQNSKPGLRFDGTNDQYVIDSAEYRTIFVVAKYAPATTFSDYNGILDLATPNIHLVNGVGGTSKMAYGTTAFLAAYKNGTQIAFTGGNGHDFAPINTYWIGSFILPTKQVGPGVLGMITSVSRFWNGDILELIVYPQKLSDAQRKNVEGYLGYQYNIATGSSYSPASHDGKVRLFSGPTGTHILVDGNEIITIALDGQVTVATRFRRKPKVFTTTSTSTLTPEIDTYDIFHLTAQAAALTIANHSSSTPADGEEIRIRVLDNGTARAITFGSAYVAKGGITPLPTTTTVNKNMEMLFEYNANLAKWNLTQLNQE